MTELVRAPSPKKPAPMLPVDPYPDRKWCRGCGASCQTAADVAQHQCDVANMQAIRAWCKYIDGMCKIDPLWFENARFFGEPPWAIPPHAAAGGSQAEATEKRRPEPFRKRRRFERIEAEERAAIVEHEAQVRKEQDPRRYEQQALEPFTWPRYPFAHPAALPMSAGVYCAIGAEDAMLYIGRSANLRQRWGRAHEQAYLLREHGCLSLGYYEVADPHERAGLERVLIRTYHPPLNRRNQARDVLLTSWVPYDLHEQMIAYGEQEHLTIQELITAGLIYVLQGTPSVTRKYSSMKYVPDTEQGETEKP